jgi:hypothetical protein
MAFHLAHSILSGVYFSLVRLELQIPTDLQCIRGRSHSRVGSCKGNLFRGKENIKLSPLGEKWLRSGAEKSGREREKIKKVI